jgi:hypothetical protein
MYTENGSVDQRHGMDTVTKSNIMATPGIEVPAFIAYSVTLSTEQFRFVLRSNLHSNDKF